MRLPIISFAVFAVCFGLFGCSNAKSLPKNQNNSTNGLLLVVENVKVFTLQQSTKGVTTSPYQIESHSTLSQSNDQVIAFTSTCVDNNIYILKQPYTGFRLFDKKSLEVLQYNGNNKLKITKRVENMFDDTISITSDYVTGKIYWISEFFHAGFSMKVTDKSFENQEYIIRRIDKYISKLQVYPKLSKIFFLSSDKNGVNSLEYISTSPDSTANLLFSSEKTFKKIDALTMDYTTGKLCWNDYYDEVSHLSCIVIDTLDGSLNPVDIIPIINIPNRIDNLVAFNNTFYWTAMGKLYSKNGDGPVVEKADLPEGSLLSTVPSICQFLDA